MTQSSKHFGRLMALARFGQTIQQIARDERAISEAREQLESFRSPTATNRLGDGRLATADDIPHIGDVRLTNAENGNGLFLGILDDKAIVYDGDGHLNTYGRTRSGKGATVIFNVLAFARGRSFVIPDFKDGENAYGTAKYREEVLGERCIFLGPSSIHGEKITHLNPLRILTDITARGGIIQSEAVELSFTLVPPKKDDKNEWVTSGARRLIETYLEHLAYNRPEECNLVTAWSFLNSSEKSMRREFAEMVAFGRPGVQGKAAQILSQIDKAAEGFESVRDEAVRALASFQVEKDLAKVVVEDGPPFDFASLKTIPTTVYILCKSSELNANAKWATMVLNYILETVAAAKGPIRTTFLLDEFPQIPQSPAIIKALRLYAGKGIQLWTFSQGRESSKDKWSEPFVREIEEQAAVNQFWGISDANLIRDIETLSGNMTVILPGPGYSAGPVQNASTGLSEQRRPVLQAEDILRIQNDTQLLRFGGFPYFLIARRIPWFRITPWKNLLRDARQFIGKAKEDDHA